MVRSSNINAGSVYASNVSEKVSAGPFFSKMEKKISERYGIPTLDLALDTIKLGKQALIFANTKRSAEKAAEDIAKKITQKSDSLTKIANQILKALSRPTRQCQRLAKCVEKGIAFHHAGLNSKQREIIEDNFRNGKIKIIASTPTLAAGIDMPAFRTILKDLRRYTGRGLKWIPVLEYLQMSGRAGRPGKEDFGESIIISSTEAHKDEVTEKYIHGVPEEIYSKLAVEPVLRTYLLSLIATNFVKTRKQIMEFFSRTFWAFQYRDVERLEKIISKMLQLLTDYKFITSTKEDFTSAADVEDEKYKATLVGLRVAQLYIDPMTASYLIKCMQKQQTFNEFSLLQMVSYTLEMRPLLRVGVKEYEDINEKLIGVTLLCDEPALFEPEYDTFLNSVKTAFFMHEWISEKDEEYLLERFNIRPGEIKVKLDNADWLLYSCEEMASLLKLHKIISEIKKLRFRLKYGVKEELLALLKLKDVGRVRARKLFNNQVKNLGDVKKASYSTLSQLIGVKVAAKIKEQVGEKVEIKKTKLTDY